MPQHALAWGAAGIEPQLGTVYGYGVVAGSAIANTGRTTVGGTAGGDMGVSPGVLVTGFPPGIASGSTNTGNLAAVWAQQDITRAYSQAAGMTPTADLTGQDLGGRTLVAGVYAFDSAAQLTGNLTLDGAGDPESVWVFKVAGTLGTAPNSRIRFINGAQPCHVFWQAGNSVALGADSEFVGTLMAQTSITAGKGAVVRGRLLARDGSVTLDTNTITNDLCAPSKLPAVLHVIKRVINDSGGTAVASDFNVHVMLGAIDVAGSPARGAESPGTTYTLKPGRYAISEDASATYRTSFGQDGGDEVDVIDGVAYTTLAAGQENTITITNSDIDLPPPPTPALTVTKTADPPSGTRVDPGQTIEYRLAYENSTAATTTGGMLRDALGPEVDYEPGSLKLDGVPIPDAGNYDPATRSITAALAPIPPKTRGVLTFKVTVGPWATSRAGIENVGTWIASGGVAGTTAPVYHYVDSLDITKRVTNTSGGAVRTGSVLQWNIYVTNRGVRGATNVVVTDAVPSGTTYVKHSISFHGDDGDTHALRWDVDTIDVGETVMLTFKTTVKDTVANGTVITNRAVVRSDVSPVKSALATSTPVVDTPTKPVNTSGTEGVTLGLMGLLAASSLGLAWSGRGGVLTGRRNKRVIASVLVGMIMLVGAVEVGATYGLPSPGEAITAASGAVAAPGRTATGAAAGSGDYVSIPGVGVKVRLVEGSSMKALSGGLWRQPTSVKPGRKGACVIAGHRVSKQFRNLKNVRVGDAVWVRASGKTFKYRVASVSTKTANKSLVFRIGIKERLVLYTCVPKWQGDKRTIIVCDRVQR